MTATALGMTSALGAMGPVVRIAYHVMEEDMKNAFPVMEEGRKNVHHVMDMVWIPMGTAVLGVGVMGIKDVLVALVTEAQNVSLAVVEVIKIALGVGERVIRIVPNVMVPDLLNVKLVTVMGK